MALWHGVGGIAGDVLKVASSVVMASRRPPAGTFQPATRLSRSGALAGQPRAAATTNRVVSAWAQSGSGSSPRVCVNVSTATAVAALCQQAKRVDQNSVDVAAGSCYGIVTWLQNRKLRGGQLYLASYRK